MSVVRVAASSPFRDHAADERTCGTSIGEQPRRDPFIDLVRAGALMVVVVWHWVFTTIRWADDGPHVGNPVATTPGLWMLTWVLQVMPAFFMIGGLLHSDALGRSSEPVTKFWARRTKRLVVPVLPLVLPAFVLIAAFSAMGREDLVRGVILIISPMWFLGIYMVCIAIAPLAKILDQRFGWLAVAGGMTVVALVDWIRIGLGRGGWVTGALAFVGVWGTVHQLGFRLGRLRNATRRTKVVVTITGYSLLALAAALLVYPAAMVGLDGHKLSNMGPPTLMVVLLAIGQMGLLSLAAPALTRFARRHEAMLNTAGAWSMTIYAWHLCGYAIFWYLLVRTGITVGSRTDAAWWIQRPAWLIGPALFAIPLCRLTRRFDRSAT